MATRMVHEMEYDAPVGEVAAMLSDQSFREEVCLAQRATSHKVTLTGDVNAKEVTIEMVQPTDRVPAVAQKIVGDSTTIVQTEKWSSPTQGDVVVTIPGKPGEMRGTATLVEKDGKTVETVDLEIKVKIPLVGGKIEDVLAKILRSALKAEHRTGQSWLSR